MDPSFFTLDETAHDGSAAVLLPTRLACSAWSDDQLHGVALAGALARSAEAALLDLAREDLQAARMSVDLFRRAAMAPCTVTSEVVRDGPRICLVDVALHQDGERVARASFLFLKPSESAAGVVWSPDEAERPTPPPLDVVPVSERPRMPIVHSGAGWSQQFAEHQNSSRKQTWTSCVAIVAGEPITPFQAVAALADGASVVTNWGAGGIEHINTDITLALARRPHGAEIGLSALDRIEADGIAVGTAVVFDRTGPLGTVVTTSIANTRRSVDFS